MADGEYGSVHSRIRSAVVNFCEECADRQFAQPTFRDTDAVEKALLTVAILHPLMGYDEPSSEWSYYCAAIGFAD